MYDQRLGLPFPQYAWRYIWEAVKRRAELIWTEKYTESAKRTPPEGHIRDALETFSKQEWILLLTYFGREDLDPLRHYLDASREELERIPNWKKKYEGVLAHAIKRNLALILSIPNLQVTNVTGPMWAATWRQHSRAKNLEGASRPPSVAHGWRWPRPWSGREKWVPVALRDKFKRLEKAMQGKLSYFELVGGRRYYFDPQEVFKATFLFFTHSMEADYHLKPRPEPPNVLKAAANAKDRREALSLVLGGSSFLPVDKEALVERGEFVPRSLVAGRKYEDF
jgi:hypothetical protein